MTKVYYIISDIDKALAFEWIARELPTKEIELSFILLNSKATALEQELGKLEVSTKRIQLRSGLFKIVTWIQLFFILLANKPHVIHTHMRYATLLGITSGFVARIKSRIHTRHYSTSNHLYYPHAVKYDRLINSLSTKVISISDVVTNTLTQREGLDINKISKIPHGFDLNLFSNPNPTDVVDLKQKYIPNVTGPVIGIISRYLELKGHVYCIRAFKNVLKTYPTAHLLLANAVGPYKGEVRKELSTLPSHSFTEIVFEPNVPALYKLFDIFVHIPIYQHVEAFGQTYVEALAAGIPSVFTLSGIANEFITNRENALVVDYKDAHSVQQAIEELLSNTKLQKTLSENGIKSVEQFELSSFIQQLNQLYQNV